MAEGGSATGSKLNGVKIPIKFQLRDLLLDGAVVKPLTYATLAEYVTEAMRLTAPKVWEARIKRVRMARQISYYAGPAIVPVSIDDVATMPIMAAHAISAGMDALDSEGKPGKVIKEGDGIERAIVYELGTPITLVSNKETVRISELEFAAQTYGEVEDIIAEANTLQQCVLLIASIGKPLGSTLMRLPSQTVAQITIADGVTISNEVLPHFLGSPVE